MMLYQKDVRNFLPPFTIKYFVDSRKVKTVANLLRDLNQNQKKV